MEDTNCSFFDTAAAPVSLRLAPYLRRLPERIKAKTQEIRLRVNRPVCLSVDGKNYFLAGHGISTLPEHCVTAEKEDVEDTFRNVCSSSVYSHQNEIRNGYVTIRGGHRVGVCGTAVVSGGRIEGLRDISSLNIRVARQINGAANELLFRLGEGIFQGVLLAGAPSTGKTTLLRDLARQLSSGSNHPFSRVAVIDERGELGGTFLGEAQNDLGNCDILDGYPKSEGILQAVRALSPELIVCDELGGERDAAAVREGLSAGVAMVVSVHAGSREDLLRRAQVRTLLLTGAFQTVVLLDSAAHPGKIKGIYKAGELLDQIAGNSGRGCGFCDGGVYGIA
ncbi:Stage III sporulation protein AA [Ruminococcaceae bacterium BL-6]|jgi:stage III sporulation protein AA|nr:Stage III sporulation protein AA [Ruminococcaceae bacterium BL-6]